MALGAVVARILTQYSDKGSKAAQKDIAKLGDKFDAFSKTAVRSFGVAAAAAGAFAVKFASDSVNAALTAQAAQQRLRQLLLTTNGATEEQIIALNQQAEALERVGVVTAGNVTVVQSQLATFDLFGKTIHTLTPAILDYVTAEKGAAATADQFKQMTNGLAQALNGNFGSLTRTGFVLDENTKKMISTGTETERAAAIVKVLESTYKGFNESLRDTDAGSIQSLKNALEALKQTVGTALLPIVRKFTQLLQNDLLPKLSQWVALNQDKLVASFEKAALAAYDLFVIAVKFGEWVVNNTEKIKTLAVIIGTLFVVSKIASFILALKEIIKLMAALRTTALGAAVATALATGGVSVGTAVTALAAVGATALVTKNLFDIINGKDKAKTGKGISPRGNSNNRDFSVTPYKDPFADALNKNTKAVTKNTKSIMDVATENAMKELAARQKALSGSASIAIGGGGKLYGVRNDQGVIVNVSAGAVVGSTDALIEAVKTGLQTVSRRNGGSGGNRYIAQVAV